MTRHTLPRSRHAPARLGTPLHTPQMTQRTLPRSRTAQHAPKKTRHTPPHSRHAPARLGTPRHTLARPSTRSCANHRSNYVRHGPAVCGGADADSWAGPGLRCNIDHNLDMQKTLRKRGFADNVVLLWFGYPRAVLPTMWFWCVWARCGFVVCVWFCCG